MTRNLQPVPNRLLWRFQNADPLPEDTPRTVRRVYEVIVAAEARGDWTTHALTGSVKIDPGRHPVPEWPEAPDRAPLFTDPKTAERNMLDAVARARRQLDEIENVLASYGGSHFTVRRCALNAPIHPFCPKDEIIAIMRQAKGGRFWVHGEEFGTDESGAWRPVTDTAGKALEPGPAGDFRAENPS